MLAGILVLVGMVLENGRRRREDAAVLACLGLPRGPLEVSLAVEFAALGLVAAVAGLAIALPAGLLVVRFLLRLPVTIPWEGILIAVPVFILVTALAGILASLDALRAKPLETLRSE